MLQLVVAATLQEGVPAWKSRCHINENVGAAERPVKEKVNVWVVGVELSGTEPKFCTAAVAALARLLARKQAQQPAVICARMLTQKTSAQKCYSFRVMDYALHALSS